MRPVPVNRGPFAWSTSQVIMRRSSVRCWDTNGYYRALGIPYPYVDATARQIREAFLALDGPNDARLTMIFSTFLDPVAKAAYDATPLGQMYPDREVLHQRKVASLGRGDLIAVDSKVVDGQIVYDVPDGYEMITDTPPGSLDSAGRRMKDDPTVPAKDPYYPYSILLWDTATFDSATLEEWQALLIQAAQESYSAPEAIGLGVTEGRGGWVTGKSLGIDVVFVDRWSAPTLSVAREIIARMAWG